MGEGRWAGNKGAQGMGLGKRGGVFLQQVGSLWWEPRLCGVDGFGLGEGTLYMCFCVLTTRTRVVSQVRCRTFLPIRMPGFVGE